VVRLSGAVESKFILVRLRGKLTVGGGDFFVVRAAITGWQVYV
jgi:hypothetical protein